MIFFKGIITLTNPDSDQSNLVYEFEIFISKTKSREKIKTKFTNKSVLEFITERGHVLRSFRKGKFPWSFIKVKRKSQH